MRMRDGKKERKRRKEKRTAEHNKHTPVRTQIYDHLTASPHHTHTRTHNSLFFSWWDKEMVVG